MVLDFFGYLFWGAVFFVGLAGAGSLIFDFLGISYRNIFFKISVSFFLSLCVYILLSTVPLFFFGNTLVFLKFFTLFYLIVSFGIMAYCLRGKIAELPLFFRENWQVFFTLFLVAGSFFLLIHDTSMLDEWLHRPIVKYFTTNGEFPLVNPYSGDKNFIYSYHYGMQLFASGVQLLTQSGVSQSLDIPKMSYLIATFLMFYGIMMSWSGKKKPALLGAVLVLFCGSSFFLMDAFTTSHFYKARWFEQLWVMNGPFISGLAGITYVSFPLSIAFSFAMEDIYFRNIEKMNFVKNIFVALIIVGFFVVAELFAAVGMMTIAFLVVLSLIRGGAGMKKIFFLGVVMVVIVVLVGVYFTGGVAGKVIRNRLETFNLGAGGPSGSGRQIVFEPAASQNSPPAVRKKGMLELRDISDWGYPSEKRIMKVVDHPMFYLRNFMLEILIFGLIAFLFVRKRMKYFEMPAFFFLLPVMFLLPFIFSSSFGDLNLYKLTAAGIVYLHLAAFYAIFKPGLDRRIYHLAVLLIVIGSLPGAALGFNVQWQVFSSAGKSMKCSQNPACYKPETVDMFEKFERENPGIKTVFVSESIRDAQKVIDLSNSKTVRMNQLSELDTDFFRRNKVEYVYYTENLRESGAERGEAWRGDFYPAYTDGKDQILKIK